MSVHEAAIEFIERAGLGFHVGSSVVAIASGDLARARYHLERAERVAGPSLPAPVTERAIAEPIPEITVGHGVAPVRHGETRRCAKCGESKGGTAFRRGADVCTKCERVKSPFKVIPMIAAPEAPDARAQAYWRECAKCHAKRGRRSFAPGSDVCKMCTGEVVLNG